MKKVLLAACTGALAIAGCPSSDGPCQDGVVPCEGLPEVQTDGTPDGDGTDTTSTDGGDDDPIDRSSWVPPIGIADVPSTASVAVDEEAITAGYTDEGLVVTIPVSISEGLTVDKLTLTVDVIYSAQGDQKQKNEIFVPEPGVREFDMLLTVPPKAAADHGAMVVAYTIRAEGLEALAAGARSLYFSLPKPGIRLWTPTSAPFGSTTLARAWVADLVTGDVGAGAEITIGSKSATADAAGSAALEVPLPETGNAHTATASSAMNRVPVSIGRTIQLTPPEAPTVFVTTDKPIYRPGQTIHIRTLMLDEDNAPAFDQPLTISVQDGKGTIIFEAAETSDSFGVAALTAPLAKQVNLGDYLIKVTSSYGVAMREVEVTEQKLPKFALTVTMDAPYFEPDAPITGVVSAKYFFGPPVVGGAVTITGPGVAAEGITDAEGLFAFELPGTGGPLDLEVSVADTAGFAVDKKASVAVTKGILKVSLTPESPVLAGPGPWDVYVFTRGPLGGPTGASCSSGDLAVEVDATGVGVLEIAAPLSDPVVCTTSTGLTGQATADFTADPSLADVVLRTDRAIYTPGEPIEVEVMVGADTSSVYLDRIWRGGILNSQVVTLVDGRGTATLQPLSAEVGAHVLTAILLTTEASAPTQVHTRGRVVFVRPPAATVSVSTDAETYLPGGEATLTFQVSDEQGAGQPAAIGVAIADEAVFALKGAVGPKDVAAHFLLSDAPSALGSLPLASDLEAVQTQAKAALAGEVLADLAGSSVTKLSQVADEAKGQSLALLRWHLAPAIDGLKEAVQAEELTERNAQASLDQLVFHDPWGQPVTLKATVKTWNMHLQFTSRGMDEKPGTADDLSTAWQLYFPQEWGDDTGGDDGEWGSDGGDGGDWDQDASPPSEPGGDDEAPPPAKRTDFPETLYVNPMLITDPGGQAEITIPLADAITAWRVQMVANTATGRVGGGLGEIVVFQDFFVELDLPRQLTQNDAMALPVGVFNFSEDPIDVEVTVETESWFELTGPNVQTVTVPPGKSVSAPFPITVVSAGVHSVSVTATSATLSDGLERVVRVIPDGALVETAISGTLEGPAAHTVAYPADAIDGGNDLFAKMLGGPSAQMVDGMETLLTVPRGCFEPMMNSTWINALVAEYLAWSGSDDQGTIDKAKSNLDDGYQQCATFECKGGGFTWFGAPAPGHPILTAFALIMFHDIEAIRPVDTQLVARARSFLFEEQDEGGSWDSEQGTKNQLMPWDELRSTCIVTWGLSESGYEGPPITNALAWLMGGTLDLETDSYTLAMCANALLDASPQADLTDQVVAELLDRGVVEDGKASWITEYEGFTHGAGPTSTLETTALVAQALYRLDPLPPIAEDAMKYLAANKAPNGGFLSTQGTIQALRAFVAAAKLGGGPLDADVTLAASGQTYFEDHFDDTNNHITHIVDLSPALSGNDPVDVSMTRDGTGKPMYSIVQRYYVPWNDETRPVGPLMDIAMTFEPTTLTMGQATMATITVTSTGPAEPSDMPMVEFSAPPGFDADLDPLDALVASDDNVDRYQIVDGRVQIYLHHLPEEPGTAFELTLPMSPRFPMTVTTPAAKAWSYYKPEQTSESFPAVLTVTQ